MDNDQAAPPKLNKRQRTKTEDQPDAQPNKVSEKKIKTKQQKKNENNANKSDQAEKNPKHDVKLNNESQIDHGTLYNY